MTSYQEAIDFLYGTRMFGMKLGLQNIRHMLDRLGSPDTTFLTVHIAGTNGKGSVAAMVESILRLAGIRTGLFTSPHISTFRERIRVNGGLIAREEVVSLVDSLKGIAENMAKTENLTYPTFFEIVTAMAARYFRNSQVEIAVIETGLGGRLDATNAFPAKVNVITAIGLEHQQYLGNTLSAIAAEKAGIIKRGASVISSRQEPEAMEVIRNAAAASDAPLLRVGEEIRWTNRHIRENRQFQDVETPHNRYDALESSLIGLHQADNVSCAVAAIESLREHGFTIEERHIREGIRRTTWPARFEIVGHDPTFILDTAANPHAATALVETLAEWKGPGRKTLLVLGMLEDKDYSAFSRIIAASADEIIITEPESDRALSATALAETVRGTGFSGPLSVELPLSQALETASMKMKSTGGIVLVTGSLFLMARTRAWLGLGQIEDDFSATDSLSGGGKETV